MYVCKRQNNIAILMNVKEKQKYDLYLDYIGNALTNAYEKANPDRQKEIANYMKCINNMDSYTRNLEIKLMLNDTKKDSTFRRKRLRHERPFEKNG